MKVRVLTGAALTAALVLVYLFSHTVAFPIVIALCAALGVYEMLHCLGEEGNLFFAIPALLAALALPFCGFYLASATAWRCFLYFAVAYLFWMQAVAVCGRRKICYSSAATVYVSTLYVLLGFFASLMLRMAANGLYLYVLIFIGAWVTDTFAYFTGRFFGRHKLIEEISPKKTVEGSVGGTLFCVGGFALYGFLIGRYTDLVPQYPLLLVGGLGASVVAQFGDLIASLIKREHDVKDYGRLFPGHGGVMDRFDSVLAAAPFLYILATLPGAVPFFQG